MKCRHCGTEISDRALICYRCGEATTAPRIPPPAARPSRGPVPMLIALVLFAVIAVMVIPELEPGTPRAMGWAVLLIIGVLSLWRLRPRRERR